MKNIMRKSVCVESAIQKPILWWIFFYGLEYILQHRYLFSHNVLIPFTYFANFSQSMVLPRRYAGSPSVV